MRKCNVHLQYYKIDLSFSIKLQQINLYVCEEYKTKREAQRSNISERKARRTNRAPWALVEQIFSPTSRFILQLLHSFIYFL